ncbi:hypothetical protein LX32DRAFT_289538 [Colletotrichum zoysiae]|uniref:Uncharacterized protein n=1 Tax=Colletotrichum zoysiae TaxID=1216348 RepID=A0AAD9H2E8_9PEZI|nr:hypothetical protein LX32DRAFT_289538 [Colletotrichum zoysiae]
MQESLSRFSHALSHTLRNTYHTVPTYLHKHTRPYPTSYCTFPVTPTPPHSTPLTPSHNTSNNDTPLPSQPPTPHHTTPHTTPPLIHSFTFSLHEEGVVGECGLSLCSCKERLGTLSTVRLASLTPLLPSHRTVHLTVQPLLPSFPLVPSSPTYIHYLHTLHYTTRYCPALHCTVTPRPCRHAMPCHAMPCHAMPCHAHPPSCQCARPPRLLLSPVLPLPTRKCCLGAFASCSSSSSSSSAAAAARKSIEKLLLCQAFAVPASINHSINQT